MSDVKGRGRPVGFRPCCRRFGLKCGENVAAEYAETVDRIAALLRQLVFDDAVVDNEDGVEGLQLFNMIPSEGLLVDDDGALPGPQMLLLVASIKNPVVPIFLKCSLVDDDVDRADPPPGTLVQVDLEDIMSSLIDPVSLSTRMAECAKGYKFQRVAYVSRPR